MVRQRLMAHKSTPPETVLSNAAFITMCTSVVCTATIGATIVSWVFFGYADERGKLGVVSTKTFLKVLKIQGIALGVCIGCIVIAHLMYELDEYIRPNSSKLPNKASDSKIISSNTEPQNRTAHAR